jgi:hypothetical protein
LLLLIHLNTGSTAGEAERTLFFAAARRVLTFLWAISGANDLAGVHSNLV